MHRPDAKITFSNAALDATRLKEKTLEQATVSGELKIEGRKESFAQFMGLLDSTSFRFNIVTP